MSHRRAIWTALVIGLCAAIGWQAWLAGQQAAPAKVKGAADAKRFEFEVTHSFDAKYPGDTRGHIGRAGGFNERQLRVALGDAVYRGEEKIGVVTTLTWNRGQGSLEVEFDPVDKARICVGDRVWVTMEENSAANKQ